MRYSVDTNVPIVANGRGTNASPDCRSAAINFLLELLRTGRIVLDDAGQIETEYRKYLNPAGQPGVGDRFFQEVIKSSIKKIERVTLHTDETSGEYLDFPQDSALANFDPSDKKFVAAALRGNASIAHAVDEGWILHTQALALHAVTVNSLCGCNPAQW